MLLLKKVWKKGLIAEQSKKLLNSTRIPFLNVYSAANAFRTLLVFSILSLRWKGGTLIADTNAKFSAV